MNKIKKIIEAKISLGGKIILSILAVLFIFSGFFSITNAEIWGGNYFRRSGTALIAIPTSLTLGSESSPISAGYFTTLNASTSKITNLEISGSSSGDLDMGYYNITGAKQITADYFTATSTTATSTFANDISITSGCYALNGLCIKHLGTNTITVGAGGQYATLKEAVDSISGSSSTTPTTIKLLPGEHSLSSYVEIDEPYVTIEGSGRTSSILNYINWNNIRVAANNVTIRNLGIIYSSSLDTQSAIQRSGKISDATIEQITINATGPAFAINWGTGDTSITSDFRNLRILTEGGGISTTGHTRIFQTVISMYGASTGWGHYGVRALNGRTYIYNSWMGVGYNYTYDLLADTFGSSTITGATDEVIVFYVPSTASANTRVQVYSTESFARNEDVVGTSVPVNVVRLEESTTWFRVWGSMFQSELPSDWASIQTVFIAVDGAKFDQYGSRISQVVGDFRGSSTAGMQSWDVTDDATVLDKFNGLYQLADTSGGAFSIKLNLKTATSSNRGDEIMFVKTDSSSNPFTIDLNGNTFEGSSVNPTLTKQYDKLSIFWTGTEWIQKNNNLLMNSNVGIGTSTPQRILSISSGASATTTIQTGDIYSGTGKTCWEGANTTGAVTSFYFVGTTMVIEANTCK